MRTSSTDQGRDRLVGSSYVDELAAQLCGDYRHVAPAIVRACVDAEYSRLADARLQSFIPILVERAVRERLGRPTVTPTAA
ncbi:three-helix bundle dimerization domain-containing protein [Aeromicrobium sp.]|uniref:three-helix bundle dimerization domain-containing protein n=1 Tax=Aeromicrobium sp. TaxID=1871063 RepID=UPI00198E83DC|nr:hypothetical protein [Aeromicrobium sp.]MBC7633906.1 hypothetical protein [Aeromicrobium sp.]